MATSGHLRIPNNLVEVLARLRLNGTQWQILWAVWRRTLCWQQQGEWGNRPYPIGISDVVDATGLNESQVKREMAELVGLNLILRDKSPDGQKPSPGGRGRKPMTFFNLDMTTWKVSPKGSELETLSNSSETATLFNTPETVAEKQPFSIQKGSELETLNEVKGSGLETLNVSEKGSELETLNEVKGSGLAPQTVAKERPFNDKRATLSVPKSGVLNKHLKKHKETNILNKQKKILNGNVYLTEDQHQDLIRCFGEIGAKDKIEALSLYMLSKGKSYVNHYATILNWERMNAKKQGGQDAKDKRNPRSVLKPSEYTKPEDL